MKRSANLVLALLQSSPVIVTKPFISIGLAHRYCNARRMRPKTGDMLILTRPGRRRNGLFHQDRCICRHTARRLEPLRPTNECRYAVAFWKINPE